MYYFRSVISLLPALALAACAAGGMIQGALISEQGKVLEFQIEKAHRTGEVTARDPGSGEKFTGRYVGILERISANSSTFVQSGSASASGFGYGSMGSNIANASAYLTGDKGTTINCDMKIEAGFSPHGIGGCSDQRGGRYRLQF